MDNLALQFAEEAALRQIETCTDLAELKKRAVSLMRGHFSSRVLIGQLLEQGLPRRVSEPPAAPPEPA